MNLFTKNFEMRVRDSLRLYSQRLNVFVSFVILPYIISTNGGVVAQAVNALPMKYKLALTPFIAFGTFWLVTWARLRIQGKGNEQC